MEKNNNSFKKIDTVVYERWFHRIVSHWHLFLIGTILAYSGSYIYLRYTNTVYSVLATVLVKDATQNINPLESSRSGGDFNSFARSVNLTNEIKIFTSRRLIEETINKMDWRVTYFAEGNLKNTEVYKFSSFRIEFPDSNNNIPFDKLLNVKIITNNQFGISFRDSKAGIKFNGSYNFDHEYTVSGFIFSIKKYEKLTPGMVYIIKINSKGNVIGEYSAKVKVAQTDKTSSILNISSNGPSVEKEKDFINSHCASFVKISLNDKNLTQERTINFIDRQLDIISDTLRELEGRMIGFRKRFSSANVEMLAEKRFEKLSSLEDEKAKYELNKRYFQYLKDYLNRQKDYADIVAPSTIGISEPLLNTLLTQLIELKMKQNTSFKVESKQSPFKIDNENKINQIKKNIIEVIENTENANKILSDDINNRIALVIKSTSNILENERNYIELKRKYKINEELYNLLLKKRSEMSIIKAGNVSDTKIVDYANVVGAPYPNVSKIYTTNFILALIIPFAYILFKYLTNYRIMEKDDVTNACEMPFLGAVGHIPDEDNLVILHKPKSALAESFRSIRANLYYFLPKPQQKVILITSSLSGEGKTFTSLNIASVIALSGKNVILIGADMRKPKTYLKINTKNQEGLSNYLANKCEIDNIILRTEVENLDFICSGSIPPNPAELLTSQRTDILMKHLRANYDYILIDTPPVGLVTDAMSLMKYSDLNIYIIRHNFTQTKYLKELNDLIQSGLIENIIYILNDYDQSKNYGYGYKGYAYPYSKNGQGYYEEQEIPKKSLFTRIKGIFKKRESSYFNS